MVAHIDVFEKGHINCEKVWKQPEADLTQSVPQRAVWWAVYGEHGTSSNTIWNVLSQDKLGGVKFDYEYLKRVMIPPSAYDHPYDPSDFKRCYMLLKAIPEWRLELDKMKAISPVWSKLVDNWDKLTEMLEQMMKDDQDVGMYKFMQELTEKN